jgi:hypothetical protein
MRLELLFLYPNAFVLALSTRTSSAIVAGETIDTAFSPYFPLKHSRNKAQQCNTQSRSMANACTALNTVTRKPGLSGFFSSSERTNWHISAGVAVFENCDVEEEEDEEEVFLLDVAVVVRLPGAALLRSSSFSPSLWSFEDLEMLPLLRRLSPPLVFSSDDGEKEEEEEEEEALPLLPRRPLPFSQRRAPLLVSLLLLLDDDDDDVVIIRREEGAPERRRECIFFFHVYFMRRNFSDGSTQRPPRG